MVTLVLVMLVFQASYPDSVRHCAAVGGWFLSTALIRNRSLLCSTPRSLGLPTRLAVAAAAIRFLRAVSSDHAGIRYIRVVTDRVHTWSHFSTL